MTTRDLNFMHVYIKCEHCSHCLHVVWYFFMCEVFDGDVISLIGKLQPLQKEAWESVKRLGCDVQTHKCATKDVSSPLAHTPVTKWLLASIQALAVSSSSAQTLGILLRMCAETPSVEQPAAALGSWLILVCKASTISSAGLGKVSA